MNIRRLRAQRQKLQQGAVPHRHWIRRHEWRWMLGGKVMTGEIGRVETIRFLRPRPYG